MLKSKNLGVSEGVVQVAESYLIVRAGRPSQHGAGVSHRGSGDISLLTGEVHYGPACAMAGRKPTNN